VRDKATAADAFEGRGPGTAAGEAAAQWIADELKRIGVKPANHGSYFQSVPAVSITLDAMASTLAFATPKGVLTPKIRDDVIYWTPRFASPDVKVANSPLVFVGYGVVAPEYHWNDYAGIDVKGKTVVVLVNDPGNEDAKPDAKFFKGKAMTYYGRWTYKYEEAARQGAAAVIIVHETKPAAYGWPVVRDSWGAANMELEAADKNARLPAIQGWITRNRHRTVPSRGPGLFRTESRRQQAGLQGSVHDRRKPDRLGPFAHHAPEDPQCAGHHRGRGTSRRCRDLFRALGP
jgi:hypothetical protein